MRDPELLARIVESSEDAIISASTDGLITSWNGGAERLLGYTAAEAMGQPIAMVAPPGGNAAQAESLRRLAAGERVPPYETVRVHKDGRPIPVSITAAPLHDASGRVVGVAGIVRDATERHRMQELAKRSAASAELLSRANHELRTPLNAILGFSELLEQRLAPTLEPRERRYIQNIRSAGEHLLALIDRLLQIAKADSGKLELQRSVIGLAKLVEQPVVDATQQAGAAGVALTIDPLPQASVRIDRASLAVVLSELLANAITATPPGGSVCVRATVPDDDLVLEVMDTGRGIPLEAHGRVFGVFERIHDDNRAGTGLGLALCRDLVELHGGTISFESEPGRGTTFRVHIPHAAWQRQSGERVLIVEDDPNDADLAMSICTEAGIRCEVVGTIAEALTSIGDELPCAAVVDLHLPDGSGREVLASLRAADASVPVLLVTAELDSHVGARRGERVTKPVDPDRLRTWLLAATAKEVPA